MVEIAAIVLAAGRATRYGAGPDDSKVFALLDGRPLVAHVVEAALLACASPVLVVSGHAAGRFDGMFNDRPKITIVNNPDFASGMATSIKAGITALPVEVQGALVLLADMPLVSHATLRRLIAVFCRKRPDAIVPTYQGRWGNPALVGRSLFPQLLELSGDRGARSLLTEPGRRIVACDVDDPHVLTDIDTCEALVKLAARDRGEQSE